MTSYVRRARAALRIAFGVLLGLATAAPHAQAEAPLSALDACLAKAPLPRIARVLDPNGNAVYARVVAQQAGVPTHFAALAPASTPLAQVFDLAAAASDAAATFVIDGDERAARLCSPVGISEQQIDDEERIIVAAGLNYAAHAEEAGGGDVFVFPKPSAPTSAYRTVHAPEGVVLLDYEIELAFVVLEDLDLANPPSEADLLARTAWFVSNDVSDREPIVAQKPLVGQSTGYPEAKGQRGFLPAGPWMVRGRELFAAAAACGHTGLGLSLSVDEGDGPVVRQSASTLQMILQPRAFLRKIARDIEAHGRHTGMPFARDGNERFHALAVDDARPSLPAGSIVLTGTPEGVALQTPDVLGLTMRGLAELRGPISQFLAEEKQRAADGEPGGYLKPGDTVIAQIDGLGRQIFGIGKAGTPGPPDPCL